MIPIAQVRVLFHASSIVSHQSEFKGHVSHLAKRLGSPKQQTQNSANNYIHVLKENVNGFLKGVEIIEFQLLSTCCQNSIRG